MLRPGQSGHYTSHVPSLKYIINPMMNTISFRISEVNYLLKLKINFLAFCLRDQSLCKILPFFFFWSATRLDTIHIRTAKMRSSSVKSSTLISLYCTCNVYIVKLHCMYAYSSSISVYMFICLTYIRCNVQL